VAKFDWPANLKIVDVTEEGALRFIQAIVAARRAT